LSRSRPTIIRHAYSQLNVDGDSWQELNELLFSEIPLKLSALQSDANIFDFFRTIIDTIPVEYESVVENRTLMYSNCDEVQVRPESDEAIKEYIAGIGGLLASVAKMEIYSIVSVCSNKKLHMRSSSLERIQSILGKESVALSPAESCCTPSCTTNCAPRKSQLARLMSFSAASGRSSLVDLLPLRDDVEYPIAFMTLFLAAFLRFEPKIYTNVANVTLVSKIKSLIDTDNPNCPGDVKNEVQLIQNQIEALSEYGKFK
jgi:hypothetical protein